MDRQNVAELLKHALGEDQLGLLHRAMQEATGQGFALYLVGGAVRDFFLERPLSDLDLTLEGDAIALARALARKHGGGVTAHLKFGTAKWFLPEALRTGHKTLDLISARSETYQYPGALPSTSLGTIEDDLRRRDFTINAMALRLDGAHFGELQDPFRGRDDLEKGLIRVLHSRSFVDDPTRMYRAVRYGVRYGFRLVEDTLALIPEARAFVEKLSPQRIRHELDLILDEPDAVAMLKRLDELDLLTCIHPALGNFDRSHLAAVQTDDAALQNRNSRWLLWLMHLTDQEIEFIYDRLHLKSDLLKMLRSAALLETDLPALIGLKPSQIVELLEAYSIKALEVFSVALQDEEQKNILNHYLARWWGTKPKTTGHDLKARGIPPGPKYNEILRRLRAAWLDGEVKTEEEEKRLLSELLQ